MNERLTHEQSASVRFTGYSIKYSGNVVTKALYLHRCVYATTLGPEILAIQCPDDKVKYLEVTEYFDFLMHHVGYYVMVGLCVAHGKDGFNTLESAITWGAFLFLTAVYYIHVYYVLLAFVGPLMTASKVGLHFPLNSDENIENSHNKFIEITAEERTRYHCTDSQSFLFAFAAGQRMKIDLMVYNDFWKFLNLNFGAYMNVNVHLLAAFVLAVSRPQRMATSVAIAYVVYYILFWCTRARWNNACCQSCMGGLFKASCLCCGFVCCRRSDADSVVIKKLRSNIDAGLTLQRAKKVNFIDWNCFDGRI